mmetsp:Transcript_21153/g.48984  ORF Transcript_21153/g.48984 Transcript_21153/m.48984 type:complete len:263 (-) Transcript_21153:1490-2278(-)
MVARHLQLDHQGEQVRVDISLMDLIQYQVAVISDLIRTVHENLQEVACGHVHKLRSAGPDIGVTTDLVANCVSQLLLQARGHSVRKRNTSDTPRLSAQHHKLFFVLDGTVLFPLEVVLHDIDRHTCGFAASGLALDACDSVSLYVLEDLLAVLIDGQLILLITPLHGCLHFLVGGPMRTPDLQLSQEALLPGLDVVGLDDLLAEFGHVIKDFLPMIIGIAHWQLHLPVVIGSSYVQCSKEAAREELARLRKEDRWDARRICV